MLEIYAYNAGKGDCIRIRFGNRHNIFVDTGVTRFGPSFRKICNDILTASETLDALILTHVDNDHIGGLVSSLRSGYRCPFQEVWMNHSGSVAFGDATLSTRENAEVYSRLKTQGIPIEPMVEGGERRIETACIKILNPKEEVEYKSTSCRDIPLARHSDYGFSLSELAEKPISKHDKSANNKKSIVFTFEYEGHRLLITGDAWSEDVVKASGIFDLVKLPHHGSVGNISEIYPDRFSSKNFLICADGVGHPNKQSFAKLEKWYGEINVFSPVAWWKNGFFIADDKDHKINYQKREGLVLAW